MDEEISFAEAGPSNIVLSSLRIVEPAQGSRTTEVEMRLYETTGQPTDAFVRLRQPVDSVVETNFLGEPARELGKIELRDGCIRLRIPPWKIANLRIRLKE